MGDHNPTTWGTSAYSGCDLADRFARLITLLGTTYLFIRIGMGLLA